MIKITKDGLNALSNGNGITFSKVILRENTVEKMTITDINVINFENEITLQFLVESTKITDPFHCTAIDVYVNGNVLYAVCDNETNDLFEPVKNGINVTTEFRISTKITQDSNVIINNSIINTGVEKIELVNNIIRVLQNGSILDIPINSGISQTDLALIISKIEELKTSKVDGENNENVKNNDDILNEQIGTVLAFQLLSNLNTNTTAAVFNATHGVGYALSIAYDMPFEALRKCKTFQDVLNSTIMEQVLSNSRLTNFITAYNPLLDYLLKNEAAARIIKPIIENKMRTDTTFRHFMYQHPSFRTLFSNLPNATIWSDFLESYTKSKAILNTKYTTFKGITDYSTFMKSDNLLTYWYKRDEENEFNSNITNASWLSTNIRSRSLLQRLANDIPLLKRLSSNTNFTNAFKQNEQAFAYLCKRLYANYWFDFNNDPTLREWLFDITKTLPSTFFVIGSNTSYDGSVMNNKNNILSHLLSNYDINAMKQNCNRSTFPIENQLTISNYTNCKEAETSYYSWDRLSFLFAFRQSYKNTVQNYIIGYQKHYNRPGSANSLSYTSDNYYNLEYKYLDFHPLPITLKVLTGNWYDFYAHFEVGRCYKFYLHYLSLITCEFRFNTISESTLIA